MIEKFPDFADGVPELRSAAREASPPPELEDRVVRALQRAGLLSPSSAGRRPKVVRLAATAAASLLIFLAGWWLGTNRPFAAPPPPQPKPTFALFLRQGPNYRAPVEAQQRVEEYKAWAARVREAGVQITGQKLKQELFSLTYAQGQAVLLLGRSEPEPISGFFLLESRDLDQALQVAKSCPHLRYGGTIEVRPIDPV